MKLEKDRIIETSGVVIIKNGRVLLVRHGEKASHLEETYGLPAGRIEKEENDVTAAVRELFEETGLSSDKKYFSEYPGNRYEAIIKRKDGKSRKFTFRVFICSRYKGEIKKSSETSPEWIEVEKMHKLNLLPNVEKAVNDAVKFLNEDN